MLQGNPETKISKDFKHSFTLQQDPKHTVRTTLGG